MVALSHWLYALAAFYGVVAIEIARRAQKPNCRTCAHRQYCPIRQLSLWEPGTKRCYEMRKPR